MRVCVYVRACVRACVYVCVCACVRACVRECVCVCVYFFFLCFFACLRYVRVFNLICVGKWLGRGARICVSTGARPW